MNRRRYNIALKGFRVTDKLLKPVYGIYEKRLEAEVKSRPLPRHVAIIPDGNRRWAKMKGFKEWYGHKEGYKKMREVLLWLLDLGIETVTVFAMSTENCTRRSEEERRNLFDLISGGLRELAKEKIIHEHKVKVNVIGKCEMWPKYLKEAAEEVQKATQHYNERYLYVAVCYGGRQEIVDAVKKIAMEVLEGKLKPEEITEETISEHLYTAGVPDPDLIIRTSGEERISNFLLWQSAYSEFYFADMYWPEIRKIDILRAIRDYQRRKRRYGK
nr:polyprenyl diphosphate synthase [Ignicoccus islandicus]